MHECTSSQARTGAARKPPTDKNIGHDIYRSKSKYSSGFLLFDKWPAIVTESHSALLEGDHGIETNTDRIKGTSLHADLYVHGHDLTVMTRANLWIILNTFKCANKPIVYPWGKENIQKKKNWRIDIFTNLIFCFSSPTKSGYLSYRERSEIESEKG